MFGILLKILIQQIEKKYISGISVVVLQNKKIIYIPQYVPPIYLSI